MSPPLTKINDFTTRISIVGFSNFQNAEILIVYIYLGRFMLEKSEAYTEFISEVEEFCTSSFPLEGENQGLLSLYMECSRLEFK